MWTHFWDMHSGGSQKLDFAHCYIEASEDEAINIFTKLFDRSPYNVTCHCCGEDYSVSESETLEAATEYQRSNQYSNGGYDRVATLEEYSKAEGVRIIYKKEFNS